MVHSSINQRSLRRLPYCQKTHRARRRQLTPMPLVENRDLDALEITTVAVYSTILSVIFVVWFVIKAILLKTWREKPSNWPASMWSRWKSKKFEWHHSIRAYISDLTNSLAYTRWSILWMKMVRWSWSTALPPCWPKRSHMVHSSLICSTESLVTSKIWQHTDYISTRGVLCQFKYPDGVYHLPISIFEKIEEEGRWVGPRCPAR